MTSDDPIDPGLLSENPLIDFQRAEEMRAAASKALMSLDSRNRILKSTRAHTRKTENFTNGQLVFVWRQSNVGVGQWKGPGVVVIATA